MDDKLNLVASACIAGDMVPELLQLLPHAAHIKEIQTGRYLFSNQTNAKIYEIKDSADLIGLVVDDIEGPDYVKAVRQLDAQVKSQNRKIEDKNRLIINRNGILRLQLMLKIPLRGYNHQNPQCILTLCYDHINQLSPAELFTLYLKAYSQKALAIQFFLKHLKIDHYFKYHDLTLYPTQREISLLIKISEFDDYLRVAQSFNVSYKTVLYHLSHLKNKIYPGTIENLISILRNRTWTILPSR